MRIRLLWFRLICLGFLVATAGCASVGGETGDIQTDVAPQPSSEVLAVLPTDIDLVARISLTDVGEKLAPALVAAESFEPHLEPYETEEGQDRVDISWPDTMDELGGRLILAAILEGISTRRPAASIHRMASASPLHPLPPLNTEAVTGPAWIGYSVDDGTRQFYDWANSDAVQLTDSEAAWSPHIRATVVIPTTEARSDAAQYMTVCEDPEGASGQQRRRYGAGPPGFCERIADVYADNDVLAFELVTDNAEDRVVDDIEVRPSGEVENTDLVSRLGQAEPTSALATFLSAGAPGYYARIDGLRRLSFAEHLVERFDVDADDYDRVATLMRALQTRVYGDLEPQRHDIAVIASIDDQGLSVDSFSTPMSGLQPDDHRTTTALPAPHIQGPEEAFLIWRIDFPSGDNETDDQPTADSSWDLSSHGIDASAELLQGMLFVWMARPSGMDYSIFEAGIDLSELQAPLRQIGSTPATLLADALTATGDDRESDFADNPGLISEYIDRYRPDSAAIVVTETSPEFGAERPDYGMAIELYYSDEPTRVRELESVVAAIRAGGLCEDGIRRVDAQTHYRDRVASIRIGLDVDLDDLAAPPLEGPSGGQFRWSAFSGELRENLDRSFTDVFRGIFPPNQVQWRPRTDEHTYGTTLRFGSSQPPGEIGASSIAASSATVDEKSLCTASTQARIATLFDAGEHHQMGVEQRRRELQERRRRARRFQGAFRGRDVETDEVAEALRAIELPVEQAVLTARHHATLDVNIQGIIDALEDCARQHPEAAREFEAAAESWHTWRRSFSD